MIKNYTSEVPVDRTLTMIHKLLSKHGVHQIMTDYQQGIPAGISFVITTPAGTIAVKLPARIEKVKKILFPRGVRTDKEEAQVQRTAWKNIHDWIDAQLALVQTEMVRLEEVFLPYIVNNEGKTLFEQLEHSQFQLPTGTAQAD